MARALRNALVRGICARTRPSGSPMKIVRPAKAPRMAIWLAGTGDPLLFGRGSRLVLSPAGGSGWLGGSRWPGWAPLAWWPGRGGSGRVVPAG